MELHCSCGEVVEFDEYEEVICPKCEQSFEISDDYELDQLNEVLARHRKELSSGKIRIMREMETGEVHCLGVYPTTLGAEVIGFIVDGYANKFEEGKVFIENVESFDSIVF